MFKTFVLALRIEAYSYCVVLHRRTLYQFVSVPIGSYLIVTFVSILFKSHVDDICNRASRQINSFKRFSKYLKVDRRLSVYKSFIQSNFSYCPVAWLFCGRKNSNKLAKLQERALRIVFDDFSSSYEFLCERANTLPLSFYRLRFLGIEMYKCIEETNPTYLNDLFCDLFNQNSIPLNLVSNLSGILAPNYGMFYLLI